MSAVSPPGGRETPHRRRAARFRDAAGPTETWLPCAPGRTRQSGLQGNADPDVYVTGRTSTQFDVRLREGDADVEFSYRLVARGLGYEDDRLELAPWAKSGPASLQD